MKRGLFAVFLLFLTLFSFSVSAVVINVPANASTIQGAIDSAVAGDVINISAGTYAESVIVNKDIAITGAGIGTVIDPLINQNGFLVTSDGVTIQNLKISLETSGVDAQAIRLEGADSVTIANNIIETTGNKALGIWIGGIGFASSNNLKIENNLITITDESRGIYAEGGNPAHVNWEIKSNTITANLGNPLELYDLSNSEVSDNTFITTSSGGSNVMWFSELSNLINLKFKNNILDGSSGSQLAIGTDFRDAPLDPGNAVATSITGVIVSGNSFSNWGSRALRLGKVAGNGLTDVTVNYNEFLSAGDALRNTDVPEVNAEYNWWGACDGPSNSGGSGGNIIGNADYNPWLGACAETRTSSPLCVLKTDNVTLYADSSSQVCIEKVKFGVEINGTWQNYTGTLSSNNILGNYTVTIPNSMLVGGQNVFWTVYSDDCYNHTTQSTTESFYVNKITSLNIAPSQPDGLNGWYVTEPSLSLSNSDSSQLWYRWDSMLNNLYTGAFGLENIPNLPEITAGTLELNYFSDVCANESNNQKILYVDLTSPQITDLTPERGEMIYSDKLQLEAYLDEVYGSNSGINKSSVVMKLDNLEIVPQLISIDAIDVIARYNVTSSLAHGWHNASIYAQDYAGNWNMSFWNFYVNLSKSSFNLTINMPNNGNYSSRKIIFNISSTSDVDLSYINYDDESPSSKKLCDSCDEYGKTRERTKTLNEGWNNLIIKGEDSLGNKIEESRAIFIDSKKPKIIKTLPKNNQITNGSGFYIKFIEENVKKVSISYNQTEIIITNCQDKNQYTECFANLDLGSLDGKEISLWFNVSDGIWNKGSKPKKILVDSSSPVLGNITTSVSGRYVSFNIPVDEVNLKEIGYREIVENNLKYVKLCSSLRDDACNVKKSFSYGNHNLTIQAVDEAGNSAERDIEIVV